jgi:hypothetical protein
MESSYPPKSLVGVAMKTQLSLLTTRFYKNVLPVMPQCEAFDHPKRLTLDAEPYAGFQRKTSSWDLPDFFGLGYCDEPAKSRQPEHGPSGIRRLRIENRSIGSGETRAI